MRYTGGTKVNKATPQIPSTAGMVTKRSRDEITHWERAQKPKYIRTYYDLSDMCFIILQGNWEMDSCFYYEDPDDTTLYVWGTIVGDGELAIYAKETNCECVSLSAYPLSRLLEFFLDILGTSKGEYREYLYKGNHKRLGENYVKYAIFLT